MKYLECGFRNFVWGIGSSDNLVYFREGVHEGNAYGTEWTHVAGDLKYVSIGDQACVWGVQLDGRVVKRTGVDRVTPQGNGWEVLEDAQNIKQVDVGNYEMVGVNMNHEIWKRVGITDENSSGTTWEQIPGALMWVSVNELSDYWGVDEAYDVWWHQDGQVSTDPTEDDWDRTDDPNAYQMIQLDVGRDGKVWGTDGNQLYWRAGISETTIKGTHWEIVESSPVHNVAHCTNGLVYVVTHDNKLRYRVEGNAENQFKGTGWASFSDVNDAAQVTCGLNGELLYVTVEGKVRFRDGVGYATPHGTSWGDIALTQTATHVSAGETGQVWVLFADGDAVIISKTDDISGDASSGYTLIGTETFENTGLVQLDVGVW
jgi:hypothetical protein